MKVILSATFNFKLHVEVFMVNKHFFQGLFKIGSRASIHQNFSIISFTVISINSYFNTRLVRRRFRYVDFSGIPVEGIIMTLSHRRRMTRILLFLEGRRSYLPETFEKVQLNLWSWSSFVTLLNCKNFKGFTSIEKMCYIF